MSSESERGTPPEKYEAEAERQEEQQRLAFHQFCILQHLDPDSTEAAVRYEEFYEERTGQ